ncbi:SRPBCC family protein [Gordonia sp. NPDC003429]
MATLRSEITIEQPADAVWRAVVDDPIENWFPLIENSVVEGSSRTIVLQDGTKVEEAIVTRDPSLRRFQYKVVGGDLPVEHHLGTVDVIVLEDNSSLVVYSTEIEPAAIGEVMGPAIADSLTGLRQRLS